METKVEALEDNRTKVTVTVDAADIDARIKKTYKDFANKYNFPGFRKGKAPRPIIDNALGAEAVRATVTDDVVNGTYPLAIDDCDLYPIAKPEFDETDLVEAGKPYTFSFTVTVKPEIEISSYEPVEIELPAEGTTDAEIDEQIDALREHYYSFEDASAATKVKEDSYIDLAMKATDDKGEEIPSLTTENRPYGLGANLFPAEFDEQLVGLKKGQTATFTLDMPADPPIMLSALAGKTEKINFEVEVKVVKKKIDSRGQRRVGQGADGLRKRRGPACAHRRVRHQPEGRHDAAPEGERLPVRARRARGGRRPRGHAGGRGGQLDPGLLPAAAEPGHDLRRVPRPARHHARPVQGGREEAGRGHVQAGSRA